MFTPEYPEHKNTATPRKFSIRLDSSRRAVIGTSNYAERRGTALLLATILSFSTSILILPSASSSQAQTAASDKSASDKSASDKSASDKSAPVPTLDPALAPALAPAAAPVSDESSPE